MSRPLTLEELKPDKRNPRKHNARNIAQIERSLERLGGGRSLLGDNQGNIIAGNGVHEAALNVGGFQLVPVRIKGNQLVFVIREDITPQQAQEMKVADNRTAELAEWDPEVLQEYSHEIDLKQQFYDDELQRIYGRSSDEEQEKAECPTCGRPYNPLKKTA